MVTWSQTIRNWDRRLDHEDIDEFLDYLNTSVNRRIGRLEKEIQNLAPERFIDSRDMEPYREHLYDLAASAYAVKSLGDELSIIALYKKVEIHTGRIVKRIIPAAASVNISYFGTLCKTLPFDINTVNGFAGYDELRLLNNSIKHDGKVSVELASKYPHWARGAELRDLDVVFQRLLPEVKKYVADLAEKLHAASP